MEKMRRIMPSQEKSHSVGKLMKLLELLIF